MSINKLSGLVLALVSTAALAHPQVYPKVSPAGAYTMLTFNIPHSCSGSPTTSFMIRPAATGMRIHPQQKHNWKISTKMRPLPSEMVQTGNHGQLIDKEIAEVRWDGYLEEELSEQFNISMKMPDETGDIFFESQQVCKDGTTYDFLIKPDSEQALKDKHNTFNALKHTLIEKK